MNAKMFDERKLQERHSDTSRNNGTPTRSQPFQAETTFSLHDIDYQQELPTYVQRSLQQASISDERSYTPTTSSPGNEEYMEEWRPSQLVAFPSSSYNPNQLSNLPGIRNLPIYPTHAPLSSDFFTILAQYHAYAVSRARETKQRRDESIKKYREKKRRRNSSRVIKYQTRKQLAEKRVRGPRGRFIPKEEEDRILQTADQGETRKQQSGQEQRQSFQAFVQPGKEALVPPKIQQSSNLFRKSGESREQRFVHWLSAEDSSNWSNWPFFS